MSRRDGCDRCVVTKDVKGGLHHAPTCPEMYWPNGAPRGVTSPAELARFGKLGGAMTLQDELSQIFKDVKTVEEVGP